MAYVRDLGSADLWRYSEERSRRRRAARARQRRLRRISVPLAMAVTASGTATTAFAGTGKSTQTRPAAARQHQRILRVHSTGPDVARLQRLLGVPADGVFGHRTLAAVRRFQHAHRLLVDGQVGPRTWAALVAEDRGRAGALVLRLGSRGLQVAALQRRLEIPADGDFGPITLAAVKAFQRTHGLVVDGQAGPDTLGALHRVGHWRAPRETRVAAHPRHAGHNRHHHRHHAPDPRPALGERAVRVAEGYLGVPYVWGGESPSGFDCSGLVQYVYARLGVELPRTSYQQFREGTHVSQSDLRPGDLVFFDGAGHVGIYAGHGRFIHAPHTGTSVQFGGLSGWYLDHYTGAVRVGG